jgi:hypothetical protein
MSDNNETERPLDRRLLLRGGAVLAGAAGVTVIGAAMGPTAAQAADGQTAVVGQPNTADSTTSLAIGAAQGSAAPTLALSNAAGPVLRLTSGSGYDGGLKIGEVAVTEDGPEIGVDGGAGAGAVTTWLATGLDLDQIPITLPINPERLLDTRTAAGREGVRTTSRGALNSNHQLKAGAWLDVAIATTDFYGLEAAFLNVTAATPSANGFIAAYPPGPRPGISTLNYVKNQSAANATFILTGVADEDPDWYVVRIFSTATTHVAVDLTGVSLLGDSGARSASQGTASQRKAAKSNRMSRTLPGR